MTSTHRNALVAVVTVACMFAASGAFGQADANQLAEEAPQRPANQAGATSATPQVGPETLLGQAEQLVLEGQLGEADRVLNDVVDLGYQRWQEGYFEAASNIFERCLRLRPDHLSATFALAEVYRLRGRWLRAIGPYTRYLQNLPNDANALYGRGYCHLQAGNLDSAITDFLTVTTELLPTHQESLRALALAYRNRGMQTRSIEDFTNSIQTMERALEARRREGRESPPVERVHNLQGLYGTKLERLQLMFDEQPDDPTFETDLDKVSREMEQVMQEAYELVINNPDSRGVLDRANTLLDIVDDVYTLRAEHYARQADIAAEQGYQRSVQQNHDMLAQALATRAELTAARMEFAQRAVLLDSAQMLTEAIEYNDNRAEYHIGLINTLLSLGARDMAMERMDTAITRFPENEELNRIKDAMLQAAPATQTTGTPESTS